MRPLLIILGSCCLCSAVLAQKQTTAWYFGEKAGLYFSTGIPLPATGSSMNTEEGTSSICDKDGNLLFYSNGVYIWNRNHELMDNGLNLSGSASSTQSSIAIPHPGADSLYYIFVVDNHNGPKGISYSLVNIYANNGLGKVISKNNPLVLGTSEKITAIHHCNNKDVWLLVRLWNSDRYYSFIIDKNGLNVDPVISFTPNNLNGHVWGTLGSMKISPNSRRVAAAHGWSINYIEIGDFDRASGEVRNVNRLIVSPPGYNEFETGPYGIEFSPDSRFLYVYAGYLGRSFIYQFDVSLASLSEIQNSKQLIATIDKPYAGSLQLAPDQKIYATNANDSSLSIIHTPNNAAPACNFEYGGIKLNAKSVLGLPNFIQTFFDPNFDAADFSATRCETGLINFRLKNPMEVSAVKWDFGDPSSGSQNSSFVPDPSHRFSGFGFYTVTLVAYRSCSIDTIRKKIYSGNLDLNLNDQYQGCKGDSLQLNVTHYDGVWYRWSNGAKTPSTKISKPGKYKVVAEAGCQFSDSTVVDFYDKPLFSLGPDLQICTNQQTILNTGLTQGQFLWNTGESSPQIIVNRPGTYWAQVVNTTNTCSGADSISVTEKSFPEINLGRDTLVCETEQLLLRPRLPALAGLNYLWQDGSRQAEFRVKEPGVYSVEVSDGCIVRHDSIMVDYKTCPIGIPNAFTPNGDGRNDLFRARYGEAVGKYLLRVYNRSGNLVFESPDQLKGWDGTSSGRKQPSGTYVWVVVYSDLNTGKRIMLNGTVILIR